jgi:hypothetical protein
MGIKDITIGNIPGPSQASKVFYYLQQYLFYHNAQKYRKNSTISIRTPDLARLNPGPNAEKTFGGQRRLTVIITVFIYNVGSKRRRKKYMKG